MKVSVAGGAPLTVVEAVRSTAVGTRRTEQGGAWSRTGQIVYGANHGDPVLSRVAANGGAVTAVTVLTPEQDSRHRFPSFLPDGSHFLFFAGTATEDRRGVYIASIDKPQTPQRRLLQSDAEAVYVALPGHDSDALLYLANGRVQAQRFDPVRRELVGPAQLLPIEAGGATLYHGSLLAASPNVLACSPSPIVVGDRIASIAEDGGGFSVVNERELQQWPRVSRDGRSLAWLRVDPVVPNADISEKSVRRIWQQHGLKPHLTRTFKISRDPAFAEKVEAIVGLYLNPPEHALVLCVDEKSQIQALDRTQPGLPLKRGRCGTMTHDYKRHGTATLFAALNTLDGSVISMCDDRHRHQEWLKFLRVIDDVTPPDKDLHLIVDNASTHKHAKVQRWLARHPRFHVYFTPTSSSWLNMVERFFRDLTQHRLRRGVFRDVEELIMAIGDYIDQHNEQPKPFIWTATATDILAKVARARTAQNKR